MKIKEITYAKILASNGIHYSDKIALYSNEQSYTYEELNQVTSLYASKLIEMGVKKGDHVVLWSYNNANWFLNFLSIIKTGAVAVLMNYSIPVNDVVDLINLTDSKFILYGRNKAVENDPDAIVKIHEKTGIPSKNILRIPDNDVYYKSLLEYNIDTCIVDNIIDEDDPHRNAVIIFTTGTTALPKAVQLSQYSIINDGNGYGDKYASVRGDSICNTLPMFHSFGLMVVTLYLHDAKTIYLHEIVKPSEVAKIVKVHETADMSGVGAVYSSLIDYENFDSDIMPFIKICLIGGSVSNPTFFENLEKRFKNAVFLNGYGQTETSPALSMSGPNDSIEKRSTSVGSILPSAEVKIWDKEKGFLPTGEVGEVIARGYFVMNGYYKMPADQQPIDDDGWLHTGDLGYLDEENFLYLTGRIKDIINKKGENISPVEIEQKIMENPVIKEVKVMGAPHHTMGESIEACIVLHKDAIFNEKKMIDELRMKISHFKIPNHFWIFDSFPLSGNGKLDQRKLKEQMLQRIAVMS